MQAEQITDPIVYHGEGPVWSPKWGGLRWLDMLAGDILTLHADGRIDRRHVAGIVAAVRPRKNGGAVLGVDRGFALEAIDGAITDLPALWDSRALRMNEGACDPQGRFYCGSMAYDHTPGAAALYRLDAALSVTTVLDNVTISNGLDWSPDGSLAYYNDTANQRTDVFDYSPETGLSNRRIFVDFSGEQLRPDGLTVDREGGVWVALANGGCIRHYTSAGKYADTIELPAQKVTACTFGGPDLADLFITTSRENREAYDEPLAGCLFRVRVGPVGLPVREFAG